MKVVFLQNIKGTAQAGDIKNVSDGYAQNFLLPRKMAIPANETSMKQAESLRKKREVNKVELDKWANEVVEKLKDVTLDFPMEANEEGHLYASVDEKMIVAEVNKNGVNITDNNVLLDSHIKDTGDHEIELELTPEIKTKIKVHVHTNADKKSA